MNDVAPRQKTRRSLKGVVPKPKLRRVHHITIRLSAEERQNLDDRSALSGLMPGSYVRQTVFGAPMPRQVRRPPIEKRELARLLFELGHIGGNINQIARAANSNRPVTDAEIQKALVQLGECRAAILKALGREP